MPTEVTRRKLVVVHTLQPDGEGIARQLVRCSRRQTTLASDTCLHCKRLAEVQLRDGQLSAVFCDVGDQTGHAPSSGQLSLPRVYVEALLDPHLTCVRTDVGLDAVLEQFLTAGVEVLPVVDLAGRLQGLLRESEVSLDVHARSSEPAARARTAGDVMLPWPLAVPEHTPLTQAAAVLAYERQHHVAIVSATGELIGVLSATQILRWLANADGYVL
jgi:CBS domain-containing protein